MLTPLWPFHKGIIHQPEEQKEVSPSPSPDLKPGSPGPEEDKNVWQAINIASNGQCLFWSSVCGFMAPQLKTEDHYYAGLSQVVRHQNLMQNIDHLPTLQEFREHFYKPDYQAHHPKLQTLIHLFMDNLGISNPLIWGGPEEIKRISNKLGVNIQEYISNPDTNTNDIDIIKSTLITPSLALASRTLHIVVDKPKKLEVVHRDKNYQEILRQTITEKSKNHMQHYRVMLKKEDCLGLDVKLNQTLEPSYSSQNEVKPINRVLGNSFFFPTFHKEDKNKIKKEEPKQESSPKNDFRLSQMLVSSIKNPHVQDYFAKNPIDPRPIFDQSLQEEEVPQESTLFREKRTSMSISMPQNMFFQSDGLTSIHEQQKINSEEVSAFNGKIISITSLNKNPYPFNRHQDHTGWQNNRQNILLPRLEPDPTEQRNNVDFNIKEEKQTEKESYQQEITQDYTGINLPHLHRYQQSRSNINQFDPGFTREENNTNQSFVFEDNSSNQNSFFFNQDPSDQNNFDLS